MFMFVCVFDCFAMTSAFFCTVAVSCYFLSLFFYLEVFSYLLLLLLHCKYCFIILLYFHLATSEACCALQKKKKRLSLYAYTYIQVTCIYKCMFHDCKV